MSTADLATVTGLFPLVARPRPQCLSLTQRIDDVAETARTALTATETTEALTAATRALNRAVLIAEDCGAPELARQLCHNHLRPYLELARWLTASEATRMLGPAIGLARLRAGEHGPNRVVAALRLVLHAVNGQVPLRLDDVTLPLGNVIATIEERRALMGQVRTHLLVSGTTGLAEAGRWSAAADVALAYGGASTRLLEGRQVLIVDRIVAGDMPAACRLIAACEPRQTWEHQVLACLTALCAPPVLRREATLALIDQYRGLGPTGPGDAHYRTRLGLTVASIACLSPDMLVCRTGEDIVDRAVKDACEVPDGYSARDLLCHPLVVRVATYREQAHLARVVERSGLAGGTLIGRTRIRLADATAHALTVLKQAL